MYVPFPYPFNVNFLRCYVILSRTVALVADLSKGLDSRPEVKVISTHISFFKKRILINFIIFILKRLDGQ